MRLYSRMRAVLIALVIAGMLPAQVRQAPPIIIYPSENKPQQPPAQPAPAQPTPVQPAAPKPGVPAPAAPAPPQQTTPQRVIETPSGGFLLDNVSLLELIDILAKRMKINYVLDPRFKGGSVTIHTYGEVKPTDLMPLLETILRVNGGTMVQVGDLYRIVPLNAVGQLPIAPTVNQKDFPDDERMVLNLIFLKYATAGEISKLIKPFLGEGATMETYEPANLVLLLDNSRNMRRTMQLIALFDSDTFATQRVRLFEVSNGRPSDIVKELENVFKAFALSEKSGAVKFMPVDRINTIIAVAPNPGIFVEVEKWLKKLDVPVKVTAGSIDNYVYRLKYGRAETVAMAIMALYGGYGAMGGFGFSGMGFPGGGFPGAGFPGGGFPGAGFPGGMMGGSMGYAGMYGAGMGYPGAYGAYPQTFSGPTTQMYSGVAPPVATGVAPNSPASTAPGAPGDLTGSYMGYGYPGVMGRIPRVIPNPFDNTLLVQGTPQEWEQISKLLEQLDVPPRQVLIEARIYEVDLTGAFAGGVEAFLVRKGEGASGGNSGVPSISRVAGGFLGNTSSAGINLTGGLLVGHSRELLALLTAQESTSRAKVISAPSLIATDSVQASINVGQEVPTLSSQAVAGGLQQAGNSLFTNTISNRNTGVTLNILARVNSSGIVTLVINQEVSAPVAPPASSAIQSPSFSRRNVQTQVTVQDGDTIAIGGIIQESDTYSSAGVPLLHRIPILGAAFGSKSVNKARTELVVFLTPRVIYDTNQIVDASEELASKLKRLQKMIKE